VPMQEWCSARLISEAAVDIATMPGAWHPHNTCTSGKLVHCAFAVLAPFQLG